MSAYASHPICPIEEKAKRGRTSVCAIPPKPPTIAFSPARIGSNEELKVFSLKIQRGAIFCQVDRIRLSDQSRPFITEGYQL